MTRASSSSKAMGSSESAQQPQTDPGLRELQTLCASFHLSCSTCRFSIEVDLEGQIEAWRSGAQSIPPSTQISALRCSEGHLTCAGCGEGPKFSSENVFTSLGVINHCCDAGRLFCLWLLLARYDEAQLSTTSPASSTPRKDSGKKLTKHAKSQSTPGVGYAPGYNEYMQDLDMYELEALEGMEGVPWGPPRNLQVEAELEQKRKSQDLLLVETLKLLTPFLPGQRTKSTEAYHLLRLSLLIDRITDLVRSNSITDITERINVYAEVIVFARAIADRPDLVALLSTPQFLKITSPGLKTICLPKKSSSFVIDESPENQTSSFFAASTDTYQVAKVFLKLADKQKGQSTASDDASIGKDAVATFCRRLVELWENLNKSLADTTGSIDATRKDTWTKFAEDNRVTFTDDVLRNHRYQREIGLSTTSTKKGRMITISKEVATMTTSLPTGIFLKIAESRSDVMKVMIVGSEGSPYAGGLFIFDLFLDAEYPVTPPKMSFVLHGNDNELHSFNPNLHRGGGVCLSILNTWSGSAAERWQPYKSTILAVLISIQAMILGAPIPWINEPGYEGQATTKQALDHKFLMQAKTVNYAMIGWLENQFNNQMAVDYVWKDISQTYWKHNGLLALCYVREWAKENPALADYSPAGPSGRKPKKSKSKAKDSSTADGEPALALGGVNLIEKLESLLGIVPEPPAEEASTSKLGGMLNRLKGKRKASDSEGVNLPHHLKKPKSESPAFTSKWVYTGERAQKVVRAACKEFGIGAKSTIADSITKLEEHVNSKGKANQELTEKWGKMMMVEGTGGASANSTLASSSPDMQYA